MKVYFGINDYVEQVHQVRITSEHVEFLKCICDKDGFFISNAGVYRKEFIDYMDMIIITEDDYASLVGFDTDSLSVSVGFSTESEAYRKFEDEIRKNFEDTAVKFRINRIRVTLYKEHFTESECSSNELISIDVDTHLEAQVPLIQYESNVLPIEKLLSDEKPGVVNARVPTGNNEYRDFSSCNNKYSVVGRFSWGYKSFIIKGHHDDHNNDHLLLNEINGFKLSAVRDSFNDHGIIISEN